MSAFDTNDLTTEINTILNTSDNSMEISNTITKSCSPEKNTNVSDTSSDRTKNKTELHNEFLNETLGNTVIKRPHNLEDFVKQEVLETCDLKPTFKYKLSKDEEFWIVDIPKTIDPNHLKNQSLQLGDKSKFKLGEDNYCAIGKDCKSSFTCIFNTDKSGVYETVNIKPSRALSIRRKLSGLSKKNIQFEKSVGVPYLRNIKPRDPFFGVKYDECITKSEK